MLLFFSSLCFGMTICIDPGHGGSNMGTYAIRQSFPQVVFEKDVTLALAFELQKILTRRGYPVFLTRTKDKDLSLADRTAFAKKIHADVFLSLHVNSSESSQKSVKEKGIETYIADISDKKISHRVFDLQQMRSAAKSIIQELSLESTAHKSKKLACTLQSHLVKKISRQRKIPAHTLNRGTRKGLYDVLLGSTIPSVLIEAGFLNDPSDRAFLTSSQGQHVFAKAVADALDEFSSKNSVKSCQVK